MVSTRECRLCHKQVDFSSVDGELHETMEESAWLDIIERASAAKPFSPEQAAIVAIDPIVHQAAVELGIAAAKSWKEHYRLIFDGRPWDAEKHRSDLDHVYQHRSQK